MLKIAKRKASRPDDTAIELLKFGGHMTSNKLHDGD